MASDGRSQAQVQAHFRTSVLIHGPPKLLILILSPFRQFYESISTTCLDLRDGNTHNSKLHTPLLQLDSCPLLCAQLNSLAMEQDRVETITKKTPAARPLQRTS